MKFEIVADQHNVYLQSTVPNDLANLVTSSVISPVGPDELMNLKRTIKVLQMRVDQIDPSVSITWKWHDQPNSPTVDSYQNNIEFIRMLRNAIQWEAYGETRYIILVHAKVIIRTIRRRYEGDITANELLRLCVECCNVNSHIIVAQHAPHADALEQFTYDFLAKQG